MRWWASIDGDDFGSLACSMALATRRCRSLRRVRPSRALIAWPMSACGIASRPAPSSTSSPAAIAASVASSSWSPSSPVAATRIGSVADWPATTTRLSTRTATGSRRSRRSPIIARIDSGSSPSIAPSVCWISSVRKKALPPVAARRSAAARSSRPLIRSSSATLSVGSPSTAMRVSRPSLARPGRPRSSSGVGSSWGTRTVATTISRPGCSWRRTCSIIVSDGTSAHCRSSSTISIGCSATRSAPARPPSRTAGSARRSGRGARAAPRARAARARAGAGRAGRARRHPPPGLGGDGAQHRADGLDHRLERHDHLGRRPAPHHDGAERVGLLGEPGAEARLAGAGLALEQGDVGPALR